MNDFTRIAVALFAVLNAPGVLGAFSAIATGSASERLKLIAGVLGLTFAVLLATALLSDSVLEWLNITPENFQLAAGIVMLTLALRLLWTGGLGAPNLAPRFWGALSLVLSPVAVVAMLSYSARFGTGTSIGAMGLAVLVSGCLLMASAWLGQRLGTVGLGALARFNGALIVLLAVELIIDGIQSV